jgi:DNA-binding LacI/PurR family transcriptional regulator
MAAMVAPALTTIAMPVVEAGEAAVHLLGSAETVQLSGALVIRASTGPADQTRTGGR